MSAKINSASRHNSNIQRGFLFFLKAVIISVLIGLIISMTLLMIFSFTMQVKDISHVFVMPMAMISIFAGSFTSGLLCSKFLNKNGLLFGALCGFILALIVLLVGITTQKGAMSYLSIIKFSIAVIGGGIGGLIGVNKSKK